MAQRNNLDYHSHVLRTVSLTASENSELRVLAEQAGISKNEYIRRVVEKYLWELRKINKKPKRSCVIKKLRR